MFNIKSKNKSFEDNILIFTRNIEDKNWASSVQVIKNLDKLKLSTLSKVALMIFNNLGKLIGLKSNKVERFLENQQTVETIINFYHKATAFLPNPDSDKIEKLPFVVIAGKIDQIATRYQLKALEAEFYSSSLNRLQKSLDPNDILPIDSIDTTVKSIPKKIMQILHNIAEIYSVEEPEKREKLLGSFQNLLTRISRMTDVDGQNVIQQLNRLYIKKQNCYSKIAQVYIIKQKLSSGLLSPSDVQQELQNLIPDIFSVKKQNSEQLNHFTIIKEISLFIQNQEKYIKKIDDVFDDFLNKVHDDLAIYEVSASRLVEEFSPEILKKPIDVTMIGVEYTGFVKEGGLAEALEGMTKAMKSQHPDNKVRLIFPKYSILPKDIKDKLNQASPVTHISSSGKPYMVYTIQIDRIEYNFIDDPSFILKGEKPSIYGPDNDTSKIRFTTFSGLAADFIKEIKTDIIHLHDWHVAGVALKLYKDQSSKKEEKIPPIVFTYHNNSRAAQGRFEQGIYNYQPIIQGLIEAGITTENINAFIEVIKKADAVTTVSETFGLESQNMERGEGVSFAIREAAERGKLTGIINGSNPHSWNPETDSLLKNWKDSETEELIDLTYSPKDDNKKIMGKKAKCKEQLQKWITQNFPQAKIDCSKPIVTYVGRLDSYQKGLDKLEDAIKETIKNGGQFIVMGSLEDQHATRILNKLQDKYRENVLFIRDYKDPNGRYHFQQGDVNRQGCGSLIRAASDFLLIPSRFEPCGLVQFEGWLFGSLAIGSNVGGLADTIISPEKNAEKFNGFLFQRDSKGKDSIRSTIQLALTTWKEYTEEQKGQIVRRLIEEGRKYSWTSSPTDFSPVEKYRFVYENAKKFATQRKNQTLTNSINLKNKFRKIRDRHLIQHSKANEDNKIEEKYNEYFYNRKFNFEKIEKMYRALPEKIRTQVPSPYGHDIDFQTYEELGAHITPRGVQFTVEAPKAKTVEVKIFNGSSDKKGKIYQLTKTNKGKWTGFVPKLTCGTKYQYLVNGQPKIDPLGLSHTPHFEANIPNCSVIIDRKYEWKDQEWMTSRIEKAGKSTPISVYEVHPLFWKKKDGNYLNYREIAEELIKHCKTAGYTHVELMGILEHPDQRSWGYQVTGFFAPNSRMGTPEDFKYLVDTLHKNNIGVYLDWIPAHFATDKYALSYFDGSSQYQPSKMALLFSLRNLVFRWGTYFFDFGKKSVRNFLISSAAYWLKEMHIDGLRVDAVRCMLLSENANSSRLFLKDLNAVVHKEFPGVTMMAEDYSGAIETTKSMAIGGLGFDQKWNIGWIKHSLEYFSKHPKDRPNFYNKIINAIDSDTFHKMILAISHDELTDKMRSLLEKSPNLTIEEKFANLRAFFGFMMSLPGKKLMFMGTEIGVDKGWTNFIDQKIGVMQSNITENGIKSMSALRHLNELYKTYKPFWQHDDNANDLTWIEREDPERKIHAYRRTSDDGESIACLHNFSSFEVKEFVVMFENKEILKNIQKTAKEWRNKDKHAQIKEKKIELSQLSYLSRYPNIAKKIINNEQLQNEFFTWIFKEKKSAREFLIKYGWQNFDLYPQEIFNSDEQAFGGQGRINSTIESVLDESGVICGYKVRMPPLSNVFISENAVPCALSKKSNIV